jgi:hypothetical protein
VAGPDYYDVLGVPQSASAADIRAAYRRLVRTAHPDRGGAAAEFLVVQEAYDTLRDAGSRVKYDESRRATAAERVQHQSPPPRTPRPEPASEGQQRKSGRTVHSPAGASCWLCGKRVGQPLLRIRLDGDGLPSRNVIVPCCGFCYANRIPARLGSRRHALQTPVAGLFLGSTLTLLLLLATVLVIPDVSPGEGTWWFALVLLVPVAPGWLLSTHALWREVSRRTTARRDAATAELHGRLADYPAVAKLLARGYRMGTLVLG